MLLGATEQLWKTQNMKIMVEREIEKKSESNRSSVQDIIVETKVTSNTVFDPAERVNMRGVANLTQVLDNWKFDIMSQVKGILQNDHQSVLPDYARYQKFHGRTVS